jgi:hypothetical protein
MDNDSMNTSIGSMPDTIDVTIDTSHSSLWGSTLTTGNITTNTGAVGASGQYLVTNGGYNWATPTYTINTVGSLGVGTTTTPGLHVTSDAEFEGDIKWKGRSLGNLLQSIEDRLAILPDPDPAKLEKFAALRKAYDHYKLMEKLIGED